MTKKEMLQEVQSDKMIQNTIAELEKMHLQAQKVIDETPYEVKQRFEETKAIFDEVMKKETGMTIDELMDDAFAKIIAKSKQPEQPFVDEVNSPIFIEKRKLDENVGLFL